MGASAKYSRAEVKLAFVPLQLAVAKIEWLVLDEQTDDFPVCDVHDRLSLFRVAVARLGVGQWTNFVEAVEVRSWQPRGLTLVEVAPQPEMAVGQCEHRLGL